MIEECNHPDNAWAHGAFRLTFEAARPDGTTLLGSDTLGSAEAVR